MPRILFLSTLLLASLNAHAADFDYLHSMRNVSYEKVHAEKIGRDFHVYTMRPDTYEAEPGRSYPTIYILDGGMLMPMLVGYYRYLRLAKEIDEAIIVAISYGASDFEDGNYRSTDYTAPSEEREWYGGAEQFQDFLESELMPAVEARNRSDAARRVIFGQSIGGQFVLFSAQTKPELFWGHIASNPALHRNLDFFLDTVPSESTNANLFVASASNDDPRFRVPAMKWIETWSGRDSLPFNLRVESLEGHSHFSVPPTSFRNGLRWLFTVDSAN